MDTRNQIKEHSRIKLSVYRKYLEKYLSIMLLKGNPYKNIVIAEPFAGKGISDNNEKGSALIAHELITERVEEAKKSNKIIYLVLNDIIPANFGELKEHLGDSRFPNYKILLYNLDANEFIEKLKVTKKVSHILYFIDPFGYTQINSNTYKEYLFRQNNIEMLFFIPTNSIYRFLRKEDGVEQLKSISNFLNDIGVSERSVKELQSIQEFATTITEALKKKVNTKFAYHKLIKGKPSKHALFFITKHILGAEKFLETVIRLNKQPDLFYELISTPAEKSLVKKIKTKALNNKELYECGIALGLLPKDTRKVLKELEKSSKITISSIGNFKRKGKSFPVDYKSYKEKNLKISVRYNEK